VPRYGTDLRAEAQEKWLIDDSIETMDQSGNTIVMWSRHMTMQEIEKIRKLAIREFYLRPQYIISRIRKIKSRTEFKENVANAILLFKNTFF
jgi:hypothetical protein